MNSLYTNELRQYITTQPWPSGLIYEIVEFEDCLKIKFYRENVNALTGDQKMQTYSVLKQVLYNVNFKGIPLFTWMEKGDGHGRTGLA